jgi:hypothetical protein
MKASKLFNLWMILLFLLTSCSIIQPKTQNGENKSVGSLDLTKTESSFSSREISVNIKQSGQPADATVQVEKSANTITNDIYDYYSDFYVFNDFPDQFQGSMEVRIPLAPEVLDKLKSSPDDYQVEACVGMLDEYDAVPENATFISTKVIIDEPKKQAVVNLQTDPSIDNLGFSRSRQGMHDSVTTQHGFVVQLRGSFTHTKTATSNHFTLDYKDWIDDTVPPLLLDELEMAFQSINNLGIPMGRFDSGKKIPVYLELLNGKDGGTNCSMIWGCPNISINQLLFQLRTPYSSIDQNISATLAHELLHVAHFEDHYRNSKKFDWLDEASAVWFETYYMKERFQVDYYSDLISANADFLTYSQYNPPTDKSRQVGYGASTFLRFMTDRYGNELVKSFYVAGKSGPAVLNDALDQSGTDIENEWRDFLDKIVMEPESYFPDPAKVDEIMTRQNVLIKASSNGNGFDLEGQATKSLNLNSTAGSIDANGAMVSPLMMHLEMNMNEIQTNPFVIKFASGNATDLKGTLEISVNSSEWAGVMVFGVEPGAPVVTGGARLGGAMDYLSSDGFAGGPYMEVKNFGSKDSKYASLLLIPFNAHGTDAGDSQGQVTIDLVFSPSGGSPMTLYSNHMDQLEQFIDNSQCHLSNCVNTTNPCPVESACGDGGCGMGEGNDEDYPPCEPSPDWCYSCMPNNGIMEFLYPFSADNYQLELSFDADGNLTGLVDYYGPVGMFAYQNNTPIIENDGSGNFKATFNNLEYNSGPNPNASLVYQGFFDGEQAVGTWTLEYQGVGTISTAGWTATPY